MIVVPTFRGVGLSVKIRDVGGTALLLVACRLNQKPKGIIKSDQLALVLRVLHTTLSLAGLL